MPSAPPNSVSFRKNHFGLQLSLNSLNSSGAEPEPAQSLSRTGTMNALRIARRAGLACLLLLAPRAIAARPSNISLPPETPAILYKIYSFDLQGAVEAAKRMEEEQPNHPLGYLLETEAMWWRIWCTSADFKYGMSDARRRPKLEADRHYFELAAKALSLAEAQIKQGESAEMQFYAGMAEASFARLYGLRGENRNAARSGVRGREHLLRAKALDADFADADMGLGLYNYYVDTLSGIAKILRFFMGIPGGSKQEGVRLLEHRALLSRAESPPLRPAVRKSAYCPWPARRKVPGKPAISIGARRPLFQTWPQTTSFGLLSCRKRFDSPECGVSNPYSGTGARIACSTRPQ